VKEYLTVFPLPTDIAAYPHSVNALNPGVDDDVRTPDKLIDSENDEVDGTHCWIAPILPNVVCTCLDRVILKERTTLAFRSTESSLFSIDRPLSP
jgi:hypothetical protein